MYHCNSDVRCSRKVSISCLTSGKHVDRLMLQYKMEKNAPPNGSCLERKGWLASDLVSTKGMCYIPGRTLGVGGWGGGQGGSDGSCPLRFSDFLIIIFFLKFLKIVTNMFIKTYSPPPPYDFDQGTAVITACSECAY